jgi:hypothetical protein
MEALIDLRREAEPLVPELPKLDHLYHDTRATWIGRMVNEYLSAAVFEGIAEQVRRADLGEARARECEAFAAEERHHGILCGAVVIAAGGEAVAPAPPRDPFPMHEDMPAREGLLRNLIATSCLSETAAVALIGAERLRMPDGPLRRLMTRIYADEVGHARFGWRLVSEIVPTLDDAARGRLEAYLALAFAHLEAHELAHLPADYSPPPEGAALGLCSGRDARALLYQCISEVMIPGLARVGLAAERAWRLRHRAAAVADCFQSIDRRATATGEGFQSIESTQ